MIFFSNLVRTKSQKYENQVWKATRHHQYLSNGQVKKTIFLELHQFLWTIVSDLTRWHWTIKWELCYKESWAPKNWCFWTVVLEKTLESPLDCKEIKPVNSKRNQSWIFIRRTDSEAETLMLCPPDAKNWLTGKASNAGIDWRLEEKGMTEDEMVGWHH